MPAPDTVAVRVRATVCRRNLVDGVLRRALTRAVPMTVRRSAGGTPATGFGGGVPAHSLSRQRCQKLGGGWVNRCVNVSGGILPLLG